MVPIQILKVAEERRASRLREWLIFLGSMQSVHSAVFLRVRQDLPSSRSDGKSPKVKPERIQHSGNQWWKTTCTLFEALIQPMTRWNSNWNSWIPKSDTRKTHDPLNLHTQPDTTKTHASLNVTQQRLINAQIWHNKDSCLPKRHTTKTHQCPNLTQQRLNDATWHKKDSWLAKFDAIKTPELLKSDRRKMLDSSNLTQERLLNSSNLTQERCLTPRIWHKKDAWLLESDTRKMPELLKSDTRKTPELLKSDTRKICESPNLTQERFVSRGTIPSQRSWKMYRMWYGVGPQQSSCQENSNRVGRIVRLRNRRHSMQT